MLESIKTHMKLYKHFKEPKIETGILKWHPSNFGDPVSALIPLKYGERGRENLVTQQREHRDVTIDLKFKFPPSPLNADSCTSLSDF